MRNEGKSQSIETENYQSMGHGRTISLRGFEELYKGYLACLSYADYELGRLLDVVDELKLWDNTIVVFTADHGMHLGEKGIWGKWTLFDETSRVPLIIHNPSSPSSYGQHYKHPVELIDIFPTLVELAAVPLEDPCPYVPLSDKRGSRETVPGEAIVVGNWKHIFRHAHCFALDGTSLAPAFSKGNIFEKNRDFSLTQRLTCKFKSRDNDPTTPEWIDFCPFKKVPRDPPYGAMGYAARSRSWRYIAWLEFDVDRFLPSLHLPPLAEELYDHRSDIDGIASIGTTETINLANNNEYSHIVLELRVKLYDFLWYNSSFEHLFQKYSKGNEMRSIVSGRVHQLSRPHLTEHPGHFYKHHSAASSAKVARRVTPGANGFLSSVYQGNVDSADGVFTTLSGFINMTSKANSELESYNNFSYFDFESRNRDRMKRRGERKRPRGF